VSSVFRWNCSICFSNICVEICPQINHMKLNEHTWKLILLPNVYIARFKKFLFIALFRTLGIINFT
jgi:hypothetical protein